jgi:hypothetical protein
MESSHLTDEILQAYLLKEIHDDTVSAHLTVCSTCRERLEKYQFLTDNVKEIKPETFSFDVAALAMNTVMLYEQKKRKKQEFVFWGILVILLIAISSFSIPYLPKIIAIFSSKSVLTALLVTGTGLVVLLFLLADIIRNYKAKEDQLFKNNLQPIR